MLTLRRATPADAAKLSLVGGASFLESFADDHPGDALVNHVRDSHSIAVYEDWLNDPAYALWIVEEALGAPVGYAMLGPGGLPGTTAGDFEIKRIYVLRRWHGGGFGKRLFLRCCQEARMRGATRVFLAVYTANQLAQQFYTHQGMSVIGKTIFMVGETEFTDLVMAMEL
ncbi:MAG: GNAT family N-acetyltransferase [Pseudomonadota bacterium]